MEIRKIGLFVFYMLWFMKAYLIYVLGSIIDLEEDHSGNPFRWSPTLKRKNPTTLAGASNETAKNECATKKT